MLPSRASMKVTTRVISVWNAITIRSLISLAWSSNSSGMADGRSITGSFMVAFCSSAFWMRRSMSRMASRYSLSLLLSRAPKPGSQARHVFADVIENAALLLHALQAGRRIGAFAVAEQALEHRARIDFHGIRRGGSAPGNRIGVGATVAGVAAAGQARLFEADFERCQLRVLAEFLGGDLIRRNPGVDVRALGLLGMHAGEPGGAGARVVARAVAQRAAVRLRQSLSTSSLSRNGSSGFMVGGNSNPVPSVAGSQRLRMIPFGTYTKPSRTAGFAAVSRVAAIAGTIASSSGSASVAPNAAQKRAARERFLGDRSCLGSPPHLKCATFHDRVD